MCTYTFFKNILLLPLRIFRFCFNTTNINSLSEKSDIGYITPRSIISWNIQELFLYSNTNKINNIINYLHEFDSDVICLQEVFEDKTKTSIMKSLLYKYPYQLVTKTNKKYIIGEDSGLLILSKYPITYIIEINLKGLVLPDSLANKTVMYFRIGGLNFAVTHLQSDYENISEKQINDIVNNSPIGKFILIGDLNNQNVPKILNIEQNNFKSTCEDKIIDYILPIRYYDINLETHVINIDLNNTSDHYPILANINEIFTK